VARPLSRISKVSSKRSRRLSQSTSKNPTSIGRHARAHAELQPPVAEVVEHADLLDQPSGWYSGRQ
jgi:hypothetical protein